MKLPDKKLPWVKIDSGVYEVSNEEYSAHATKLTSHFWRCQITILPNVKGKSKDEILVTVETDTFILADVLLDNVLTKVREIKSTEALKEKNDE